MRRCWRTNSTRIADPAVSAAIVRGSDHPHVSLWTTPREMSAAAAPISTTPSGAGTTASGSLDSPSTRRPTTIVNSPIGMLIRKTQCQLPTSTRIAPRVGPSAPARAPVDPQMATASGTLLAGNARSTSASDAGSSAAAPTAWTIRKAMSRFADGASAHSSEPIVNTAEPPMKVRLWPVRSANLPAGISSAANTMV